MHNKVAMKLIAFYIRSNKWNHIVIKGTGQLTFDWIIFVWA